MKRPADPKRAERALAEFLDALGFDLEHEELRGTPARVVSTYLNELICGEDVDIVALIEQGSMPGNSRNLVLVADIAVSTLCPHHLLPAQGHATVAYVPGRWLLGLGTVAALVNAYARRLTLQERITEAVVETLMQVAGAEGAFCSMKLDHACLRLRGQRQVSATVSTSKMDGCLLSPTRAEELRLLLAGAYEAKPK
jgi:GTP cyclohydrolase I